MQTSRSSTRPATAPAGSADRFTVPATVERLLLAAGLFWVLSANRAFFDAAFGERALLEPVNLAFAAALGSALLALHFLLLALVGNRWTAKPLVAVLIVTAAFASHFMQRYGVYLDPSMLRNVLRTDMTEARELFAWSLLPHLLVYAVLPLLLLWRVRIVNRPWGRAGLVRLGALLLASAVLVGNIVAIYQPLSSLMRNHKEMRYLITPANVVWSLGSVIAGDARSAAAPRHPIGLDAAPGPAAAARKKPLLVVMVIGETARAANWGLSGYQRQTTPELARLPVINFARVNACGTNTEVSLPCMFAPVGRRDYDEANIRGQESLLHVLARAGVGVHWRDNQSGCKGVCEGLSQDQVSTLNPPGLCEAGRCLDEGLLYQLDERIARAASSAGSAGAQAQLLVLHQLGNHGPSYYKRYPPAFKRFVPACESDDLHLCTRDQIVNAYDNALLYTDHLLGSLLAKLQAQAAQVDSVLLYVSDHGESLGENNLYLHGIPYAIAPDVQKQVPMVAWFSTGASTALGVDTGCLQRRATQLASHDHLFHTLLGLFDVRTTLYAADWDLAQGCRDGVRATPPASAAAANAVVSPASPASPAPSSSSTALAVGR